MREGFAKQLFKNLKEIQRLPLKYLCFLFLYATEEKKDLLASVRKWLTVLVQIRRKYFRENRERLLKESEQKDKEENIRQSQERNSLHVRSHFVKVITGLLPEYCTPYFIHLLAHHSYFVNDAPKYLKSVRYLWFYFEHITQGGKDNRDLIRQMLIDIKQTRDALDPDSHNIHILAEIAYRLLVEHYPIPITTGQQLPTSTGLTAVGSQETELNTYLPESLYTLGEGNTLLPLKEYLPGWQLPSTNRISQLLSETPLSTSQPPSPQKEVRKPKNRTRSEESDIEQKSLEEEDKENQESRIEKVESPARKTAKSSSSKKRLSAPTTPTEKGSKTVSSLPATKSEKERY